METIERVKGLIQGYLERNIMDLVDITYRREQGGMTLRLLVDTPEGVTVDECETLNNYLSEVLDKEEVIGEHYVLEVASPGLDRHLKTDRDFERSMGKELCVTTYQAVDSRKTHEGMLIGMEKENIVIEKNGISTVIPRSLVAAARLKIVF